MKKMGNLNNLGILQYNHYIKLASTLKNIKILTSKSIYHNVYATTITLKKICIKGSRDIMIIFKVIVSTV